ncbi:peptide deformylase [Patescibacteria group bacterium]|nr:peptide deformylase [Patescibacteria group bacterium]MBU1705405.1 peptide deformylase [Patescibacteria group bacterium]
MSVLNIVKNPTKSLRDKSKEIPLAEIKSTRVQKLIDDLIETKNADNGIGIAAPQVGVNERLIIVDLATGPAAFINPRITKGSVRKMETEEGCLSVPGIFGYVKRHRKVHVKALDREGQKVKIDAKGLEAIIFQHEIDHLDGILFIDKVEKFTNPPLL